MSQTRIQIVDADIQPRVTKPAREPYRVPLSRRALGEFLSTQMWKRGYFVTVASLVQRRTKAGLPVLAGAYGRSTFTDPQTGRRFRGVWAWGALARHSDTVTSTLQKLMEGGHRRSPELLTILKVFRALGLELQAAYTGDTNVDLIVRGW